MASVMHTHYVSDVCMESTGIYWIPVWRLLENDRLSNHVSRTENKSCRKVVDALIAGETSADVLVRLILLKRTILRINRPLDCL